MTSSNRRETYNIGYVPADVCFLTTGVDVQKDRLEVEVVGCLYCKMYLTYFFGKIMQRCFYFLYRFCTGLPVSIRVLA